MRALRVSIALLALAAAPSGCFISSDSGDPAPPSAVPDQERIDTNAHMPVTGGAGAGLWIEYQSGGSWDVYTSCDTDVSHRPCAFDVIVSAPEGASISGPELHDEEPVDTLELRADGTLRMITGTAAGLDGVRFTTDPGAAIQIDMLLDGQAQPRFINWVSDGAHVTGTDTTTNPLVFVPTFP
jgi:hypothetical protein